MLFSALLALFATTFVSSKVNHVDSNNGPDWHFQTVKASADMGFYAFSFGASHTFAYQNFIVKLNKPVWLSVTDCYCPGDSFQLYDNGKPILVTSECPEDGPASCDLVYVTDAWQCLDSPEYCHGVTLLDTGYHNITIAVINSQSGGGAAFLRMDTICPQAPNQNIYNPINPPPACCMYNPYPKLNDYTQQCGRLCNQMVNYPRT